jgi:hypothetical protein
MAVTQLNGAQIKDASVGVVDINATGTPGSTTYLRGDGQWTTVTAAPPDVSTSVLTASVNESVAAGASAVHVRSLTINSGIKYSVGLGARARIL